MGIIYPENAERANRVQGLVDHINFIQTDVKELVDGMNRANARIKPTLDKILKDHGMKSIKELQDKIMAKLTAEEREAFEKLVEANTQFEKYGSGLLDGTLVLSFVTITIHYSLKAVVQVISSGAFAAGFMCVGVGLIECLKGNVELGTHMMQMGVGIARRLNAMPLTAGAANFTRLGRFWSGVLTNFLVVLDGIILMVELIVGSQQKAKLQEATRELFPRRLAVKYLSLYLKAAVSYVGSVEGYLNTYDTLVSQHVSDTEQQTILGELADKMAKNIDDAQKAITYKSVDDILRQEDVLAKAWTNEDPTFDEALKVIEADNS